MTVASPHVPVMLDETLRFLAPESGKTYVDATLGAGGHAEAILTACAPDGELIGIDQDPSALALVQQRLMKSRSRATLVHGAFGDVGEILRRLGKRRVHGLVADLGVSSMQVDTPERGFSFAADGPLDMRMNRNAGPTARDLLAARSEEELADLLYQLGDERRSRAIARSIKRALAKGELATTADLRRAVVRVLGPRRRGSDPATRTFLAIRIAVNGELDQLQALLAVLAEVLEDGAVAVIITFHSIEDRIVKHALRGNDHLLPLTKKPVIPTDEEVARNPRSRSAKLRAARRVTREVESDREVAA